MPLSFATQPTTASRRSPAPSPPQYPPEARSGRWCSMAPSRRGASTFPAPSQVAVAAASDLTPSDRTADRRADPHHSPWNPTAAVMAIRLEEVCSSARPSSNPVHFCTPTTIASDASHYRHAHAITVNRRPSCPVHQIARIPLALRCQARRVDRARRGRCRSRERAVRGVYVGNAAANARRYCPASVAKSWNTPFDIPWPRALASSANETINGATASLMLR
jgi:hypothetical protein